MTLRTATLKDLDILAELEAMNYLPKEACSREDFLDRLTHYPENFILLFEEDTLISFIDGPTSNSDTLEDEMYHDGSLHDPQGKNLMVFGLNTHPDYRHKGYARKVMEAFSEKGKREGKKALILTCKEELIPFYEKLGFYNEGLSASTHGDVEWYQMRKNL